MPSAMLEGFAPLLAALRSPAWQQALGALLTSTFLPTDDPDLLRSLLADIDQMPQHVAAAVAEQMTTGMPNPRSPLSAEPRVLAVAGLDSASHLGLAMLAMIKCSPLQLSQWR